MSSVLVALLAVASAHGAAAQPSSDPTTAARNAFTTCLRQYVQRSVNDRVALADFRTSMPQQCTEQEQTFRQALIRRETGMRTPRTEAEEIASMEVEDARANFLQLFEGATSS